MDTATLLADPATLELRQALCPQQVFCERLPQVTAAYASKTVHLENALTLLALALGGAAGARVACRLQMPAGDDTLLGLARRHAADKEGAAGGATHPKVIGVDDWAWRKGDSYSTVIVDLEQRRVLDLLPDRTAESLAAWLAQRPGVEVVAHGGSATYRKSITLGQPEATQVANRWHLMRNLREALEDLVKRLRREVTKLLKARVLYAP
jgi:hypothetical protein